MRLPFLFLPVACVMLGIAVVAPEVNWGLAALILFAALLANISVNLLNEYSDFSSGLDFKTQKTPFSGGSGALVAEPSQSKVVRNVGMLALLVVSAIGLYFIQLRGLMLLPLGLLGVVIIVTYTDWLNKRPWLCLISPGVGIAVVMVVGTEFVLSGSYSLKGFLFSLLPFFLINNLLLLNQYPDIDADKSVGRNHFSIAYGVGHSNKVYAAFLFAAIGVLLLLISMQLLPTLALIALFPLGLSMVALYGAFKYKQTIGKHPQFLAMNVMATILTPLLAAVAVFINAM